RRGTAPYGPAGERADRPRVPRAVHAREGGSRGRGGRGRVGGHDRGVSVGAGEARAAECPRGGARGRHQRADPAGRLLAPAQGGMGGAAMSGPRVLVARLDDAGDVLLAGPAVRAVRERAGEVVFLAGPAGGAAAELLPGVDRVVVWRAPWILGDPPPVDRSEVDALVRRIRGCEEALILTSFHQSALPLALLLRLAGVRRIAAISND